MKQTVLLGVVALAFLPVAGAVQNNELTHSRAIAKAYKGESEAPTPDGSRVDVLTDTHAWEVEYARKWPQAIGQSLFYAAAMNREPGIVLLIKDRDAERRYFLRCLVVCERAGILLRTIQVRE